MAKYRVLVFGHCVKNNKIAVRNEIVDESQLLLPPHELVGFVELVEEVEAKKPEATKEIEVVEEVKVEATETKELPAKDKVKQQLKAKK